MIDNQIMENYTEFKLIVAGMRRASASEEKEDG